MLEAAAEQDDEEAIRALERHPCPPGARHVWSVWQELHAKRQRDMGMPLPIPYTELVAYGIAGGFALTATEIALLNAVDTAYLDHVGEQLAADKPTKDDDGDLPPVVGAEDDDADSDEDDDEEFDDDDEDEDDDA